MITVATALLTVGACSKRDRIAPAAPAVTTLAITAPAAVPAGTHVDTLHGVAVPDPYRWLEDTSDVKVQTWVRSQAQYSDTVMARLVGVDSLAARIDAAFTAAPTLDRVIETPGRVLLTRYLGAAPSLFAVDSGTTTERLVIAAESISTGNVGARMRVIVPSWDGALLAVGTTERGDANAAISIVDAATGRRLPDRIPDLLTTTSGTRYQVSWLPDGSGFYYPRLWPGAAKAAPSERLARGRQFLHRLGTPQSADVAVFGFGVSPTVALEKEDLATRVYTAAGSRWLVGAIFRAKQNGTDFYAARLPDTATQVPAWSRIASVDDRVGLIQLRGDTVYALSRATADRGQVVARVLQDGGADASPAWTTVVPERKGVITGFTVQTDGIYLTERAGGAIALLRQPPGSDGAAQVTLPTSGSVSLLRGQAGVPGVTIASESWAMPPHWMRVRDGGRRIEPMPFDDGSAIAGAPTIRADRIEAPSKDGTLVPVSIVYGDAAMRDGRLSGTAPLLIETYGAFGDTNDPSYSPFLKAWVSMGGVYAWAHVRGGGELGEAWHTAALREHKQRSTNDMIGAIEALIAKGYTAAGRVAIIGVSFGANVPGLAMVQRPDLFGAVLYEVGQPDEIRGSALDPTAARNIAEIGDLETAAGIRALVGSSPYHQVPPRVALPAVIVHTTADDYNFGTQMLPAKYVARLQQANTGQRPVLWLHTPGGHQALFGLGPETAARALSFILWQTGDPRYQPSR